MAGITIRDIAIAFGYDIDKASERDAENSIKSLKNMANKVLGAIGITLSIAGIAAATKDCVALASEVEEMENKFNVVFGDIRDEVDAWAQDYADAIGRNKNDIKTYLADQQNLLVGFGMTREAGAELSEQMTTLALDLASFGNLDEESAVNNMTKAVMGASEAAKALGAVLNDSTRETAMMAMGLNGTYESLDQLTKMQVNYQAILMQSPDAIGDCERSMGSYQSTLKQFNARLKELKTLWGQFFMPAFQKVLVFGTRGITVLRDLMQRVNDFANKIGGSTRLIKLFSAALAALFAVIAVKKVIDFVSSLKKVADTADKAAKSFNFAKLKLVALFAIFIVIALLIEDFINFMQGNDSLIGSLFEKAGIDADAARQTILDVWNKVKTFLLGVWDTIKGAAQAIFGSLKEWWAQNGEAIMESFSQIWESIKTLALALWNAISTNAKRIFDGLKAFWDQWGGTIMSVFSTIWNTLLSMIEPFIRGLTAIITFLTSVFTGNWEGAWEAIKDYVGAVWDMIVAALSGAWDAITAIWDAVIGYFSDIFQGVWDAIVEKVTGIKDSIVEGFQAAIDWITSLPEQAVQWGSDIIQGIVDGITGAISWVGDAVAGVADKIKSFLGFSKPEDGPLSDFDTYMPDMIQLMAQGIQKGKAVVGKAIEDLTGGMSDQMDDVDPTGEPKPEDGPLGGIGGFLRGAVNAMSVFTGAVKPSPSTVSNVTGSNNTNRSIVQNVEINQEFNGDAAAQKNIAKAADSAADDTTGALARALAFT